ncbi:MAG TPA: hypothetical protein VFE90_22025 [Myxococcales bacterium]|jgi:hypothetical protein|nr:hypothetical protein [Myxococcales bacterium]
MRIALLILTLCLACSHAPEAQPTDPDAEKCATATDCKGMLPHLCRVCADGGSECAHWACISRTCTAVTCP